jgi:hypothetical protein
VVIQIDGLVRQAHWAKMAPKGAEGQTPSGDFARLPRLARVRRGRGIS